MLPGGSKGGLFQITGLDLTLPDWARFSNFRLQIGEKNYLQVDGDTGLCPITFGGGLIVPTLQNLVLYLRVFVSLDLHAAVPTEPAEAQLSGYWWPNEELYFAENPLRDWRNKKVRE